MFHNSYMECGCFSKILCGDEAMLDGPGHLERGYLLPESTAWELMWDVQVCTFLQVIRIIPKSKSDVESR